MQRMFHRMTVIAPAFWLACASGAASWAAAAGEANPTREQPYRVTRWTTEQGLPQNRISCLKQTRDGYLWIGTWFGLARFDGVRFTVFDKSNTPELVNDAINALAEDSDGTLWIGTADGLVSHRDHHFHRLTTADGLPAPKVWRLAACRSGGVWIQAGDSVARLKEGVFAQVRHINASENNSILALQEDADGALQIVMGQAWLTLSANAVELRTNHASRLPEPIWLAGLLAKQSGTHWLGTMQGLQRWDSRGWEAIEPALLGHRWVDFIHEDRSGNLWVNLRPGELYHWDRKSWRMIDLADRFARSPAICMEEDREGNFWVGTGDGLVQLQTRRVRAYTTRDGLAGDHVWSVCEGSEGVIWLGTGHGLSRIQDGRVIPLEPEDVYPDRAARCVWPGRDGGVQTAKSMIGVYEYRNNLRFLALAGDLPNPNVNSLYGDRSDRLWIGTGDGAATIKDGHITAAYTNWAGHSGYDVRCILEDRAGTFWFGTQGQGLTRMRDGKFDVFTERDGLSNNRVWSIHEDADGALWLGTENGLTRYDHGRFFTFRQNQGLLENAVNWILEDDFGHLWLSGLRGVYRLRREQLNAVAEGRARAVQVAAFGTADGMESSETNGEGQPAGWKARDGRLWFPTTRGVAVFDPKLIQVTEVPPPVVIEQVKADKEELEIRSANSGIRNFRLAAGRARVLEIHYTANSFCAPERVQFKYKLEPSDRDWVNAGTRRLALYTNLRPGDYQFRVKASNHHGVWNETGDGFQFTLAPHFYETWPFYALCGTAVIGLATGVTAYRLRWQRRLLTVRHEGMLAEERARIARDLHDDLGTALTGVALEIDLARRQSPDGLAAQLADSAARVRQLAERMREAVWAVNPECDTVSSLASFLEQQAGALLRGGGVRGRFDFPESIPPLPLDSETRHQLALGVREALTNVQRHAQATEAVLELALREGTLVIRLADNGRGFDASAAGTEPGHGLHNLRVRLERMGGVVTVTSKPGKGTRVEIRVPLARVDSRRKLA
ncbi:MAG: hypothetical protein QOF48_3291 [Verrucomicrobiota bacterium]|jgi:signal transduction histidine kinase/ligand-binding sensor domain-containing protein